MQKFNEFLNWFVAYQDPREIWKNHPYCLTEELFFVLFGILSFRHAWRHGGRYVHLWISTVLHAFTVECLSYFIPDIDNFWHSQTSIMFLGKRLPLHIPLVYPQFIYTASVIVWRLRLSKWAEPFAVGLLVVLIDVPFDIMGIKMVLWTWHDTDPNIYDRHYWVPWNSYYFHAAFASSLTFIFHGTRALFIRTEKYETGNFFLEVLCDVITGMFSMPLGCLQFIPLYHPLHDEYKIHSEVTLLLLLSVYFLIIWSSDRQPVPAARSNRGKWFDEIPLYLICYYALHTAYAWFGKPEQIVSTGVYEPVGPCNETNPVHTTFGKILSKRTYLCTSDYHEDYYDFHCLKSPPPYGSSWYTICGTPFPNHMEYKVVVTAFSLFGMAVFYNLIARSGGYPKIVQHSIKQKRH